MKKFIGQILAATVLILFCARASQAQDTTGDGRTFQRIFDSVGSGLLPARVPYGILYDRVIKWYNPQQLDTLTQSTLFQAWWDMENSNVSAGGSCEVF
ncbi:MAG: hypothetical protein ABI378_10935 [Chitinophagaceae bacterium]